MSIIDEAGQTPATPGDLATTPDALEHSGLSLIGLFGPQNALSALIRSPGGRIRRVSAGESLGARRILGIDANGLMLEKNGRATRLSLPGH